MLDERKVKILSAVIDDYIATAEPIGSRTIARKYHIGISPATIRNEMADLEELGYLSQPHTSAGRVPSNKGYRFYVDFLMPAKKLTQNEQFVIKKLFKGRIKELEDLVEEAAKVISKLTSYTAIILGPQIETSRLKHIQITRIEQGKGLILIVTNYGTISHHIIEIPFNLTESDLTRLSNALNDNLAGKTFSEITSELMDSIKNEMIEYDEVLNILLDILLESLDDNSDSAKVITAGSSKMLEFPEFRDMDKAINFLALLEQSNLINKVLRDAHKQDAMTITIGTENPCSEFQELSIITTSFNIEEKNLGVCGIMGPTRMEYSKVVTVIEKVTDYLNKTISNLL
jgi:heat-inducible transcriptional repressor